MTSLLPLGLLEVSGLIRQAGSGGEDEYMFRHTLMQETVYGTLLRGERTDLHRAVGRAMERAYSNGVEERASVLAGHFLKGDERADAARYFKKAGDQAARVYAMAEALEHYGQALELAKEGFGEDGDLEYLYRRRGRMFELSGRYEDAVSNYEQCEDLGRETSDARLELSGMVRRANLYCFPNPVMDLREGRALSNRTLERARQVGEREIECLALWNLMKINEYTEDYEEAAQLGNQALELAQELGLDSQQAFITNDLAAIYLTFGNLEEGRRLNRQAQVLWEDLDNMPMLTDSLANEMVLHIFGGEYDKALKVSRQAGELSEKINNLWGQSYSRYVVYWVHYDRGEIARALETARRCIEYGDQAGFVVPSVQTLAEIGVMYAYMGQYELALENLEKAVENGEKHFPDWQSGILAFKMLGHTWAGELDQAQELLSEVQEGRRPKERRVISFLEFSYSVSIPELALRQGDPEFALRETEWSIEEFEKRGMLFPRVDVLFLRGSALMATERYEEALETLNEANRIAERIGSRRVQWRVLAALAQLAEREGQEDKAGRHREQASRIIRFIADHSESQAQRHSFLELDRVRAVLDAADNRS